MKRSFLFWNDETFTQPPWFFIRASSRLVEYIVYVHEFDNRRPTRTRVLAVRVAFTRGRFPGRF